MGNARYDVLFKTSKLTKFLRELFATLRPFGFEFRTIAESEAYRIGSEMKSGELKLINAVTLPDNFKRIVKFGDNELVTVMLRRKKRRRQDGYTVEVSYVLRNFEFRNGQLVKGFPIMSEQIAEQWVTTPTNVLSVYINTMRTKKQMGLDDNDVDILGV